MTSSISKEDLYKKAYQRIKDEFPDEPWIGVISKLGENAFVSKTYDHLISYGLWLYNTKDFDQLDEYERRAVSEAIFYSVRIIEFIGLLESSNKRSSFKKRCEAAFKCPSDMRALLFEIFIFFTLRHEQWNVECKDDQDSGNTYDYLVSKENALVQVECKSFSYDKGLIISDDKAEELSRKVAFEVKDVYLKSTNELCIIKIKIHTNISHDHNEFKELISEMHRLIKAGGGEHEILSIDVIHISDIKNISGDLSEFAVKASEDIQLACIMSEANQEDSRLCVIVETNEKDAFWREFEGICNNSARKQLNRNKPSVLAIHFSNTQTLNIMLNDTRLGMKIGQIFNYLHLVELVLVANTEVHESDEWPYHYLDPSIKIFRNDHTIFPGVEQLFSS